MGKSSNQESVLHQIYDNALAHPQIRHRERTEDSIAAVEQDIEKNANEFIPQQALRLRNDLLLCAYKIQLVQRIEAQ